MTKEITKARILQEIQDKFVLREFLPSKFLFDETVVPVYNIEPHVTKWCSRRLMVNITGMGGVAVANVPATERWRLRAYSVIFVSGTFTVAGLYILRKKHTDSNDFSYLDLTAGQNVSYLRTLPEAVIVEPGDLLRINIDGYSVTGVLHVHLDYMVEEIV